MYFAKKAHCVSQPGISLVFVANILKFHLVSSYIGCQGLRYGRSGHGRTTFLAENGFGWTTFLADYDFIFAGLFFSADHDDQRLSNNFDN